MSAINKYKTPNAAEGKPVAPLKLPAKDKPTTITSDNSTISPIPIKPSIDKNLPHLEASSKCDLMSLLFRINEMSVCSLMSLFSILDLVLKFSYSYGFSDSSPFVMCECGLH